MTIQDTATEASTFCRAGKISRGSATQVQRGAVMTTRTIEWIRDADQALAEAKRAHQPALMDFTAAPM